MIGIILSFSYAKHMFCGPFAQMVKLNEWSNNVDKVEKEMQKNQQKQIKIEWYRFQNDRTELVHDRAYN